MKRTISILVIIAMMLASVLAIIPVGATEGAEGGDSVVEDTTPVGTAVATADEFKAAVEAGKDFHLTANIILPADWAPKDFGATFDGNGKTITFVGTAGLFNVLKSATIKNVTLLGETELTSGIATNAEGDVRFENVTVGVTAVKGNDVSAFVGGTTKANLTFVNCANRAFVDGGRTGGAFASWTSDKSNVVIEGCRNYGNVDADYAGGYIGAAQGASVTIKNSINGTEAAPVVITDGSTYAGGIIGESFAVINIDGLEDYVTVKGGNYVSAVVSKTTKDITVKNTNVYETLTGGGTPAGGILAYVANQDKITFRAEKVTVNGAHNVGGSWNRLGGGFVGHVGHWDDIEANPNTSSFYFVDCAMKATTPSGNCNFGGFFGGHHHSTGKWYEIVSFVRCTNFSDIVQGGNTGGFCGQGNAKHFYFEDCVNEGDVTSNDHMAGGFGSYGSADTRGNATFIRCINNGTITSKKGGKHAAGFFVDRKLSSYTFKDCVNNGEIKATGTAAAFAFNCGGNVTLITCVNKGTLAGGTNLEYTGGADSETIINSYLDATPTSTTFDGAINVFFNDMTETKDTNWIGLVKEGEDFSTAWAYSKDLKTGFNVLDLPVVKGLTITGGYYNIYFIPNNKTIKDVLAPDSKVELLADPIRIFIADGIISSAEDLKTTQPGGVYSLAADITLPEDYEPVDFSGYLDAVGHTITVTGKKGVFNKLSNATIKNLNVKADIESDAGVGVLAVTAEGNVTIDNVVVNGTVKGTEVAGFIQYVNAADTTVTITNCTNNANLTGTQKTAGFIAFTNKNAVIVIDNCVNNGAIKRTCGHGNEAGDCKACGELGGAGFIANADVDSKITIKNSTNNGSVYGMGSMAGFAGYVFGTINLENCTNNGRIEVTNKITYLSSAAGLVGIFANGGSGTNVLTIKGCTNNSDIYFGNAGYEGGGGMVGSAKWNGSTKIYFEDSVNVGDVYHKHEKGNYGGFLGWASSIGTVSFKNCTNYGDIQAGSGNNGGFLGQVGAWTAITAENCANYGNVTNTAGNTAGGFAGWCNVGDANKGNPAKPVVTIDGFANYGVITAGAGRPASACMISNDYATSITIKNVTNYGAVIAGGDAAIGIVWGDKAVCENLVNNGKITGSKIVGEFTNNGHFGELIEINNAEDFLAMKPGFNYKLMNNIVLPEDYVGGTFGSQWYTCELDGNGKTIYMKGLKSPLFDTVHGINIHDLTIVGSINAPAAIARRISNYAEEVITSNVVVDVDITNNGNTAGFFTWIGYDEEEKALPEYAEHRNIKFDDCKFLGNITATGDKYSRTGGFVALWNLASANVVFNNCVVGDKGLDTAIKGKDGRVAGFVAKLEGTTKTDNVKFAFNNCVNYADVAHTGTSDEGASGGFAGRVVNCNVTLNNCDNYGDISSKRVISKVQGVGGLVGEANSNATITIDASNNYGSVYAARSVVGGLLGAVTASSTATLKNSANYGNVENGSGWNFYAGGIVGATEGNSGSWHNNGNYLTVDNCQNYGTVTTSNANMGGIVGGIEGAGNTKLLSVTNCANYGKMNILGGSNVGGIVGQGVAGEKTVLENNVNYGYISGATGGHGVAGIIAHPYANTDELILKNNANYGIVEGGANANVAGIFASWDARANKYTYEGNVNYGTIIGVKNNTSGIVVFAADKADSSFSNNYNYGIVVCAEGNLLAPSIPAKVTAKRNYAGGVVVKNEANAALVKGLASPYNYDVMGEGRDAWMDLVKALAAAEGVTVPDEPVPTPIDFTTLTYKAYKNADQSFDNKTGTVLNPVANQEYAEVEKYYKHEITANSIKSDVIANASACFYIPEETYAITADTYYEYYINAKNNRKTGYAGLPFAMANGVPYFVYGSFHNNSDHGENIAEFRICAGTFDSELFGYKHIDLVEQQLTAEGFGQMKFVVDGYEASVYTLSGGEWVKLVFEKDGVKNDTIILPEGAVLTPGAIYSRDGEVKKQRTITAKDAKLLAFPVEAPVALAAEGALTVEEAIAALINKTALNEAKVELAAMGDVAEDDAKAVALKAAIEAMEKATTQAEIDKAAEDYAAKEETIVDLSKLNYQLAEAEKYVQTNYTAGTWYEFAKALEAAKNVDKNDQAAVDAAAAALDAAIYGLADISELTSMTQKAIAAAEALLPEDYGTAGWAVMLEKLAVAKKAFEELDTNLMDKAVVDLYTAMDALISVKELKALLAELSALNPDDYSVISYAPVGSAIVVGLTTTDPVDQAPVDNALALLRAAKAGLVNVKDLVAAIAEAEDTNPSRYTEASYAKLLNVLSSAKLVVMAADEASEVADAKAAVEAAVKALRMKTRVNTKELEALIADAEAIDGTLYTAESWDAFKAALAAAKVAVYADTQGKVREAITALEEAMSALVDKPVISTDALAALIAEVEALDFTKYTTETWSAVSAALIEAKVALKADDQAVVDAAKAALDAAKAALAEKPVVEPDETDKPTEPTEPTDPKPTEPTQPTEPADKNEGGCGGAIGATVVVMTAVLGLGATVVLKKKED